MSFLQFNMLVKIVKKKKKAFVNNLCKTYH